MVYTIYLDIEDEDSDIYVKCFPYTVREELQDVYKERFVAEYWQTKIRYEKLKAFNNKIEAFLRKDYTDMTTVESKHDCPFDLLRDQQEAMERYLHLLEVRAVFEHIDL